MSTSTVCILGGSGFVGHHLAARLARLGWRVRIPTRHPERKRALSLLPGAELVLADTYDPATLNYLFEGCDAVINLVGILNERGDDGKGFHRAHVELTQKICQACKHARVPRLLHMSALHADAEHGGSHYLRSKGRAEDLAHQQADEDLRVTSFRPSVIFGPEDQFFNRFAELLCLTPLALPLACGSARFAPVYVGDVVECFAQALRNPATHGQRYNLCGPKQYTLHELVEYTARLLRLKRWILSLPNSLSWLQARILEWWPGKPFSLDNYRSLQTDSVCEEPFPEVFGMQPTSVETIAPMYLIANTCRGRYASFRERRPLD